MAVKPILLLGNPQLYVRSTPVEKEELDSVVPIMEDLHDTLMDYREKYGSGRAIAAPQVGVMKWLIYMHVDEPLLLVNPVLKPVGTEMIMVWDDCMCFPNLLVKVERYKNIRILYRTQAWEECSLDLSGDLSELLQHELDHLDGILAFSRAVNSMSFAFANQRHHLKELSDRKEV
jgi:peptide deformylase